MSEPRSGTDLMPKTAEELSATEDAQEASVEEAVREAGSVTKNTIKSKKRLRVIWLIIAGVFLVAALFIGIVLINTPDVLTGAEDSMSLSAPLSGAGARSSALNGTASSGAASSGDSSDSGASSGSDETTSGEQSMATSDSAGSNGSAGTNTGTGSAQPNATKVWHDPWDEKIWVDTSSYQSVYAGENPIFENHALCSTCGNTISGYAAQHLLDTGHAGYYSANVQVGSTPVYENQWVSSGYEKIVHHEGYWS